MAGQGPEPTVVWNALAGATLFALGAEGLDDYRLPWDGSSAGCPPSPRHHSITGTCSRAPWEDCCSGPAGWMRRSSACTKEWPPEELELPSDWAFLAMAHARKGDLAEARRWLERLRAAPSCPKASFWDLQELALLRSEAESLLFDAGFPVIRFRVGVR